MRISKDLATTVLGGMIAVGTAAQPVMNGLSGDMQNKDLISLAVSIFIGLFGYFTNRGSVSGDKP